MQEIFWEVVWNWSPAALTPCFFTCVCGGLFFVLILLAPSAAHVHISA